MANIVRYNPFSDMVSLRDAMDHFFAESFVAPRVLGQWNGTRGTGANLFDTADYFTVQIQMPGVKPEDVEITVQEDTLHLKWETKVELPEGTKVLWRGFQSGQYQQSFTLPTPVNTDHVEAHYTDGILTLNLPKAEHAKARTVKVHATK